MKARIFKYFFLLFLLFSASLLSYSHFIEPHNLEVRKIAYKSEDLPESFVGKKIVFISDIHFGTTVKSKELKEIVKKVNDLNPDIILFGGDFVDSNDDLMWECFEILKNLELEAEKFAVLGNHDQGESREKVIKAFEIANIKNINNESIWLDKGNGRIKIGGVGDYTFDEQDLEKTIFDTESEDFVILVSHQPDYLEQMTSNKIDLVFSGHTHGGQINLFGYVPFAPTIYGQKYLGKDLEQNGQKIYVSKGVGTSILPFRFLAKPDIILLELGK